eukprot:2191620-Amphidinium_carterae.1
MEKEHVPVPEHCPQVSHTCRRKCWCRQLWQETHTHSNNVRTCNLPRVVAIFTTVETLSKLTKTFVRRGHAA